MIWVTMKNGEVRRYNDGSIYEFEDGWLKIGAGKPISSNSICRIRSEYVKLVEFKQPCHVTRQANLNQGLLESSLRVVLTEAKNATYGTEARLLSELKTMLSGFNLRTRKFRVVA